jgi:hypothetical protein
MLHAINSYNPLFPITEPVKKSCKDIYNSLPIAVTQVIDRVAKDALSLIFFPIDIVNKIIDIAKKTLHLLVTPIFIPAFRNATKERLTAHQRINTIIQANQHKYLFERVKVPCGKKIKLDGLKVIPRNCKNPGRWVVFSHGNGGSIPRLLEHDMFFALMDRLQVGILVTDYQGVGDSSRKAPTRQALLDNTQATIDYARNVIKAKQIIKWGFSFGCAVDMHLNPNVDLSIGDRGFESIQSIVKARTRSKAKTSLSHSIGWTLDPVKGALRSKHPILMLYHKLDKTIPFEASLVQPFLHNRPSHITLFELTGDLKQNHNMGLKVDKRFHTQGYRPEQLDFIADYIDRTLPP